MGTRRFLIVGGISCIALKSTDICSLLNLNNCEFSLYSWHLARFVHVM